MRWYSGQSDSATTNIPFLTGFLRRVHTSEPRSGRASVNQAHRPRIQAECAAARRIIPEVERPETVRRGRAVLRQEVADFRRESPGEPDTPDARGRADVRRSGV